MENFNYERLPNATCVDNFHETRLTELMKSSNFFLMRDKFYFGIIDENLYRDKLYFANRNSFAFRLVIMRMELFEHKLIEDCDDYYTKGYVQGVLDCIICNYDDDRETKVFSH